MTKAELANTLTGERNRAIAILKRAGWKPAAIARVMGVQEGRANVEAQIERVSLDLCLELLEREWVVTLAELRGQSTERRVAAPRGAAMWLAREIVGGTFPAIGAYFHRDHSTVISAWRDDAGWRRIDDDRLQRAAMAVLMRHNKTSDRDRRRRQS